MFTNGGIKTDFSRSSPLRNGREIMLILVAIEKDLFVKLQ